MTKIPVHNHKGYKVSGWFGPEQKKLYKKLVGDISNGVIVEIGVYGGASLLTIADVCKRNNNLIFAIDPWELATLANGKALSSEELEDRTARLIPVRENLETIVEDLDYDHIHLIQDFSIAASARYFDGISIDLIMLDADHSYEAVKADLAAWWPLLKEGGKFLGHDYQSWASVKKAVTEFTKQHNFDLALVDADMWMLEK